MPPLSSLALRYVAWFVGLSVLYGLFVNFSAVPASLATGVILASAPAADVGLQATRRATRDLGRGDWVRIWALCMGIYLLLSVAGPLLLAATVTGLREGIAGTGLVRTTLMLAGATAVMMAIFMWIGHRAAAGRSSG
jgi:ABC-type sugar transport system permease subunit